MINKLEIPAGILRIKPNILRIQVNSFAGGSIAAEKGKRCESVATPLTVIPTNPVFATARKKPGGKVREEDEV